MHKSLQVLISGNLCLKVKHFSSSGPILVTAQPLSVIHSLLPCLTQGKDCKCKMPGAKREDPRGSKAHSSHLMRDRRDRKSSCNTSPLLCLRNWLNKPLSAQTAGGWDEEKGEDWTKPYRFVKFHFQNTPENAFGFLHQHFASKECFKSQKEEARSYSLCQYLHLLFPLCFGENCSSKQLQSRKPISAVTPSDLHTPTETCPSPQTTCYFLGRNGLLLQRVNPDP